MMEMTKMKWDQKTRKKRALVTLTKGLDKESGHQHLSKYQYSRGYSYIVGGGESSFQKAGIATKTFEKESSCLRNYLSFIYTFCKIGILLMF